MADSSAKIEELVERHYREVKNLLWALTRNEATAEELAQEVFIVAMRKIDESGARGEGLRLWLRETARRLAMNEIRRKRPAAMEDGTLLSLPSLSSRSDEAETGTFDDELSALRASMTELSEEDRKLLAARYETGTPVAVIAQSRGMSVEYVKLKLFRLRKQLAAKIKRKVAQHG